MQENELRERRKAMQLTQAQMGAALGLSANHVAMMERGEKTVEPRTLWMARLIHNEYEARASLRAQLDRFDDGMRTFHNGVDTTPETRARVERMLAACEDTLQQVLSGIV